MRKPANVDHPVLELVRQRFSPRAFAQRPVPRADLLTLLEAARWAPSCYNDQPWRFVVVDNSTPNEFETMLGCLAPKNRVWASQAPVLALAVVRDRFNHNGFTNRHAQYDTGQAVAVLTVQATALGISVHQMAGFSATKAREAFGIPEGYEPITAMAIGYAGDPASLPDELRERELARRTRLSVGKIAFYGSWTKPLDQK